MKYPQSENRVTYRLMKIKSIQIAIFKWCCFVGGRDNASVLIRNCIKDPNNFIDYILLYTDLNPKEWNLEPIV